ncbi:MAG: hypothetical protein R3Y11_05270 [Pseudomonadota bacterium]
MKKELVESNISTIRELLETEHSDNAVVMIASVNKNGTPFLDTLEGAPHMSKDIVCMLLSAALASIADDSDAPVKQGYFIEPVITHEKEIQ